MAWLAALLSSVVITSLGHQTVALKFACWPEGLNSLLRRRSQGAVRAEAVTFSSIIYLCD